MLAESGSTILKLCEFSLFYISNGLKNVVCYKGSMLSRQPKEVCSMLQRKYVHVRSLYLSNEGESSHGVIITSSKPKGCSKDQHKPTTAGYRFYW